VFLRDSTRRVLAVALMALLAATFLAGVWASTEQLVLESSNPLLRIFPAARDDGATPAGATVQETTANRPDEAEDTRPEGAAFDATFVHRAAPENIVGNSTYLDVPPINGDPDAILHVTQNWNPGGGAGTYNNHPVGVWYDAYVQRWAIFNQDLAAMPEGAAFNVALLEVS